MPLCLDGDVRLKRKRITIVMSVLVIEGLVNRVNMIISYPKFSIWLVEFLNNRREAFVMSGGDE